ncbi:hypothetical protein Ctob_014550 [Chrysochromulina tobinii]|uniref:Uncharacterized protein n=1 Tax=Chrysochromulina tobinii TaxID=1460289 RepID=A0A0M0JNE9_9EUKA|nr:hypothetical protein Ctob_014550 [Chrysochromulina tobinii]|eukprot:KOO27995.1 hypothetical protein Ctob_014550 [Chrysochromulina sp. CCMP291]
MQSAESDAPLSGLGATQPEAAEVDETAAEGAGDTATGVPMNAAEMMEHGASDEEGSTVLSQRYEVLASQRYDAKLANLIDQDFDPQLAHEALLRCEGNLDAARNELLNPWQTSGHEWIGRCVTRAHDGIEIDAWVTKWVPAFEDNPALWHVRHADDDEEDLEEDEMRAALEAFELRTMKRQAPSEARGQPPNKRLSPSRTHQHSPTELPPSSEAPPSAKAPEPSTSSVDDPPQTEAQERQQYIYGLATQAAAKKQKSAADPTDLQAVEAAAKKAAKDADAKLLFGLEPDYERFEFDYDTEEKTKKSDPIIFPELLDTHLDTHSLVFGPAGVGHQSPATYHLTAVVLHSGKDNAGHYTARILEQRRDGRWLTMDDQLVKEADFPKAIELTLTEAAIKAKRRKGATKPKDRQPGVTELEQRAPNDGRLFTSEEAYLLLYTREDLLDAAKATHEAVEAPAAVREAVERANATLRADHAKYQDALRVLKARDVFNDELRPILRADGHDGRWIESRWLQACLTLGPRGTTDEPGPIRNQFIECCHGGAADPKHVSTGAMKLISVAAWQKLLGLFQGGPELLATGCVTCADAEWEKRQQEKDREALKTALASALKSASSSRPKKRAAVEANGGDGGVPHDDYYYVPRLTGSKWLRWLSEGQRDATRELFCLHGSTIWRSILASSSINVLNLKYRILEATEWSPTQQRLFIDGDELLNDEQSLSDAGVLPNSFIHVYIDTSRVAELPTIEGAFGDADKTKTRPLEFIGDDEIY